MTEQDIEAVARALCRLNVKATGTLAEHVERQVELHWQEWVEEARAAITADRERLSGGVDREMLARIIDPLTWQDRDAYVRLMTDNGGCHPDTVSQIAERRVRDSLATADTILAALSTGSIAAEPEKETNDRLRENVAISIREAFNEGDTWQDEDGMLNGEYTLADRIISVANAIQATPNVRKAADDGRTIYDHRTVVQMAVERTAPQLYTALKHLLSAVEERQGMRESIESVVLADANAALINALPAPPAAIQARGEG